MGVIGIRRAYFGVLVSAVAAAAAFCATVAAADDAVVRPENTDEILVNPDMGLVMFHYSNRQWAYGQLQERGDTLDWFPGVSAVYFRLPWCLLEPKEGVYRWDLIDSYAAPWIAAGKQIGLRVTCCESRYPFATPEWVKDAGAKGWFFKMKMDPVFGKDPPGGDTDLWEPDYGDPVFLAKLENFLKAMARRYDGNPNVAFIDVGTIGMWGEGHTRAYKREMEAQGRDIREAFPEHYRMHRRVFPNSTVLCIDDQAGGVNKDPDPPLMRLGRELGFGFRDDSILVNEKHSWFHDNWADLFAPKAPVFVEHEHYNLSRGATRSSSSPWRRTAPPGSRYTAGRRCATTRQRTPMRVPRGRLGTASSSGKFRIPSPSRLASSSPSSRSG